MAKFDPRKLVKRSRKPRRPIPVPEATEVDPDSDLAEAVRDSVHGEFQDTSPNTVFQDTETPEG